MPHQLSKPNTALLDSLAARSVYKNSRRTSAVVSVAQIKSRFSSAAMEGRQLSISHFPPPSPPKSMLTKRLRGAVLVIPTSRWLSMRASSRAINSENGPLGFQLKNRDNDSKSTESESSEEDKFSRRPSTDCSEAPMLQTPALSAPRLSYLLHAKSHSIVEPLASPPKPSRFALWQEASDKLIPLVSKSNPMISNVLAETRKQP